MISVAEFTMATWSVSLFEAIWRFPLIAAATLLPAATVRSGGDLRGEDLMSRASLRARAEAERVLRQHYLIVPDPQL